MARKKEPREKAKIGRPPVEIDPKILKQLAFLRCSIEDAATAFSTTKRTLLRRLKEDEALAEAWEKGRSEFRIGLKRLQWRHAQMANSAGVQMAIHLSKHELGEHDRQLNINMTVEEIDEAIRELEQRAGSPEDDPGDEGEH